ncbi:hypothetical protein Tco_0795924 [Tanacetum coccineum]
MEDDFKLAVQHQRRVNPKIHEVIKKEVIKLLDAGLIYPISDSPWVSPVHCVPKKGGMTVVENEDNEMIPTRCMMAIFYDMIEETMEVFMDDFSVFEDSFLTCLSYLDKMLKLCEDTNLVLNWEKCHFMVKEGIVLGHKISKSGIEVDKAKVDVIAKLSHPTSVKEFDVIIRDKKGAENLVADYLSRLENPHQGDLEKKEITETFPLETLRMISFHGDSGENHASWSDKLDDALWASVTSIYNFTRIKTQVSQYDRHMAQLKYCDKHNQVGFLRKPDESTGFAEIVDFLRGSNLRYALTANPPIYDSLVKQFWQSAITTSNTDGSLEIRATIDTIRYTISEASIRDSLQLDDATGITMLPNADLFEGMGQIGSKSGGWDQFGSNIATALICLSSGRVYNFSKLIFDGMVANLKSKTKFLMYPRFLQMILNIQTENKTLYLAVSLTKKIFGNMKRGFRGAPRPLLPSMLLVATNPNAGQEHAAVAQSQPSSSPPQVQPQAPTSPLTTSPPITTPTPPPITTPTPTPPPIPSPT